MDVPHYCTGCGQQHGGPARESEEVKIARINADRDIEVARLAHSETRVEAEAAVEQTEITADAAVEQTAIEAEAITEIGAPPAEEEPGVPVVEAPVVVEAPEAEETGPAAPPETAVNEPETDTGHGYWDAYSR